MRHRALRATVLLLLLTAGCPRTPPPVQGPAEAEQEAQKQTPSVEPIGILIQQPHSLPLDRLSLIHTQDASFAESTDLLDVRTWRRRRGEQEWTLLRRWNNVTRRFTLFRDGEVEVWGVEAEGHGNLFDGSDLSFMDRIPVASDGATWWMAPPGASDASVRIYGVRSADARGRHFQLFIAKDGRTFAPLTPTGAPERLEKLVNMGGWAFAVRGADGPYHTYRFDEAGAVKPFGLDAADGATDIKWLRKGIVAFGRKDAELAKKARDDGVRWTLVAYAEGSGWWDVTGALELSNVEKIKHVGRRFLRIRVRDDDADDPTDRTHFVHVGEDGEAREVGALVPKAPKAIRDIMTPAEGVLGIRERDDADGNGLPGEVHWFGHSGKGWVPLHELVPRAPERPGNVMGFREGRGLGVQEPGRKGWGAWHWYLRDGDRWSPMARSVPAFPDGIASVRDVRDGLLVATVHPRKAGDRKSVERRHWFYEAPDGRWHVVRDVVAGVLGEVEIADVGARSNTLLVDVRVDGGATARRVISRDRDGTWMRLDDVFGSASRPGLRAGTIHPRIESVTPSRDGGVVALRGRGDRGQRLPRGGLQLLEREGNAWRLVDLGPELEGRHVDFSPELGLLVATNDDTGARGYFARGSEGRWKELREVVGGGPGRIRRAFTFAGGDGVAMQPLGESDGGRAGAWIYRIRHQGAFRPLADVLPRPFPEIATVIDVQPGRALGIQEAGDADGNDTAHQWRYYLRDGRGWSVLRDEVPDLPPKIAEVRVSPDGRLVLVQDERDSDGDGDKFEWQAAYRKKPSADFQPLEAVLSDVDAITDATILWGGTALAVRERSDSSGDEKSLAAQGRWSIHRREGGRWTRVEAGFGKPIEIHAHPSVPLLATQPGPGKPWQLWWHRRGAWQRMLGELDIEAVRFDDERGWLAVRLEATGRTEWRLFEPGPAGLGERGRSGSPDWFGLPHVRKGSRVEIADSTHYLDGQRRDDLPAPELWLHRSEDALDAGGSFRAPALVDRAVSGQGADKRIEVLGEGPEAQIVVYRRGGRRIAAAFSSGHLEVLELGAGEGNPVPFLVNRFADGTERWHLLDDPARWVWAYEHDGRRVWFTDEGYFFNETGSLGELLTFRVRDEVYSFTQLGSYLFRPDRLEEHLGLEAGQLFALTEQDREKIARARGLAPRGVRVEQLHPPRLQLGEVPAKVTSPDLDIPVVVEGRGVTEDTIEARVLGAGQAQGAPAPSADDAERRRLELRKRVRLLPGTNRIEVTVYDEQGLSHSERVEVTYEPEVERKPRLLLAVVAAGRYENARLAQLPLTQKDAATVTDLVRRQNGVAFDEVVIKSWCQQSGCDEEPTRAKIDAGVPRFFTTAKDGDYIALFVSGHGLKIDEGYYVVPADGDPDRPETLLGWSRINHWLTTSHLGKKLVLLDTCHAGAAVHDQRDKRRLIQQAAEREGIYVLSATADDEEAYELDNLDNGLFTFVMAEGLDGGADLSGDGHVSFEEFSIYVARRVRELSTSYRFRMEPFAPLLEAEMDFPLATVQARHRTVLRVYDESSSSFVPVEAPAARSRWWKRTLSRRLDSLQFVDEGRARRVLTVLEKDGKPVRAQLTDGGEHIVGRWTFEQDGPAQQTLGAMVEALSSPVEKGGCATGRGLVLCEDE